MLFQWAISIFFCDSTEKCHEGHVIIAHLPVGKVFANQLCTETNWGTFEYTFTFGYIQMLQFCNAMMSVSFGVYVSMFPINQRVSHESLLHINQTTTSVVRMYVSICNRGTRRITTNEERSNLCRDTHIVTDIMRRGLDWLGHLIRMENKRIPRVLLDAELEAKRKDGRPKLRWLDNNNNIIMFI